MNDSDVICKKPGSHIVFVNRNAQLYLQCCHGTYWYVNYISFKLIILLLVSVCHCAGFVLNLHVIFQSVMVVEGNVMKETHRDPNDPSAEVTYITRTFNNDEMVVVRLSIAITISQDI